MKRGTKFDKDKPRWDLLPMREVEEVVKVLTFGARKYGDNNWQDVPCLKKRYYAAALRHLKSYAMGHKLDSETKRTHLAHATCSLIFVMWAEKEGLC